MQNNQRFHKKKIQFLIQNYSGSSKKINKRINDINYEVLQEFVDRSITFQEKLD
jgi:hypothetical protein